MTLSTAYLPNIQYFTKLLTGNAVIEAHENFQKQSFRNRTEIMTSDGTRTLTVPIIWNHNRKMAIREVLIDNSAPWQRTHWRAIRAAYAASPYFEHYADSLEPLFHQRFDYLWELNCIVTQELLVIFKSSAKLRFTQEYATHVQDDFRNSISPKPRLRYPDPCFTPPLYYQVFSDRQPFVPNLSIIDYLFCEGATL